MSSCEQYQELISRLADGDLSPKEERELSAHMETCPECAALYQAFSMLSRAIGEDLEDSPFDLRENVMAEIRREEIRKRNRLPNALRAVMSAAACVAVIVGVYLGVSLTRSSNLSTAAYQSVEAKEEAAAVMTEKRAPAPAEEPALAEEPAPPMLAMGAPEPDAIPEAESRLFADTAAAPAAVEQANEATEDAAPALANAFPAGDTGEEEPTPEPEEDAKAGEPAAEAEEWELRGWNLSLLRSLLGGKPAELDPEELEGCLRYRLRLTTEKESLEILVYELDGVLYYTDPEEETLRQAELTPEELELFLHG